MRRKQRVPDMHFYEWSVIRWLASDTRAILDPAGRGIYRELLDSCYTSGSIPKDPELMARKADATIEQLNRIWPVIRKHFHQDAHNPDVLINDAASMYRKQYFSYLKQQKHNKNSEKNGAKTKSTRNGRRKSNTVREFVDSGGRQEEKRREDIRREDTTSTTERAPDAAKLISSEWPLTTAEVQKIDPAVDGPFVLRLVQETIQAALSADVPTDEVNDPAIAAAVLESVRTGPKKHGAGLLLSRVPRIVITWAHQESR